MPDLVNIMRDKFEDFDITPQWLGYVLRDNNLTRKKVRKYHSPYFRYNKPIDKAEQKSKFYGEVAKYPLDKIISMDETAVQLFMHKNYARCHIGERCTITTTDNKVFKSYTLLVAINAYKVVGWRLFDDKGTSTERIVTFINDYITGRYKNNLVIMDNAPSHRPQEIKDEIESGGNHLLKSIPFYPRSNAVENFFSQLKHYLRDAETKTFEELHEAIATVIKTKIKKKALTNYFNFAYNRNDKQQKQPVKRKLRTPPRYKS